METQPRRWPWLLVLLAAGADAFAALRRRKDDSWNPAPTGDGPVPSYREDPVPDKTVSQAQTSAGDATPPDTDLGMQPQQMAESESRSPHDDTPGTATGSPGTPAGGTATASPSGSPQTASSDTGSASANPQDPSS